MNLWELDDPNADIILHLHENKDDPKKALVETSLAFNKDISEIIGIYREYISKNQKKKITSIFENALEKYVHSDHSAAYASAVNRDLPDLIKDYPFAGGRIYRGLNFQNWQSYLRFRRSIKTGYISSDRISSWGKNEATGRQFARSPQVFNFLALAPGAYDPNERVSGFIGVIVVVDIPANVGLDVNAALDDGGAEDEVILPPGKYKIETVLYEKKWKHLLSKVNINAEIHDLINSGNMNYDNDRIMNLFRLKGDQLEDETKDKLINSSAEHFLKTAYSTLEEVEFSIFDNAKKEQEILFPDGKVRFNMSGFLGLERFLDNSEIQQYIDPELSKQIRQRLIKVVNKATKQIDGKKVFVEYVDGRYFSYLLDKYNLKLIDFKYLAKNYAEAYQRFNDELRIYNKKRHFDISKMTQLLQDILKGPFG